MLDALIAGQRDPRVLAELARASMRAKISVLTRRLPGTSASTTVTCWP